MTTFWSCDPNDIRPWTEEEKLAFQAALAKAFGWDEQPKQSDGTEPKATPTVASNT